MNSLDPLDEAIIDLRGFLRSAEWGRLCNYYSLLKEEEFNRLLGASDYNATLRAQSKIKLLNALLNLDVDCNNVIEKKDRMSRSNQEEQIL